MERLASGYRKFTMVYLSKLNLESLHNIMGFVGWSYVGATVLIIAWIAIVVSRDALKRRSLKRLQRLDGIWRPHG